MLAKDSAAFSAIRKVIQLFPVEKIKRSQLCEMEMYGAMPLKALILAYLVPA